MYSVFWDVLKALISRKPTDHGLKNKASIGMPAYNDYLVANGP